MRGTLPADPEAQPTRPAKRGWFPFLWVAIMGLGVSLIFSPLLLGFGHDREVFRYLGMVMHNGGVPYRDAFDHKPPGMYFLAFLGHGLGPWGLWLVMLVLVEAAALVLFWAMRPRLPLGRAALAALFILLMRYAPILEGGQLTREATACMALMSMTLAVVSPKPLGFFFQGLLGAAIFLTQQNEILGLVPVTALGFVASGRETKRWMANALAYLAGIALVCGAILAYFAWHAAVRDFIWCAFAFNFQHFIPSEPGARKITGVLHGLVVAPVLTYTALILLVIAALAAERWRRWPISPMTWAVAGGLVLELFSASISGRNRAHYYLGLVPYIILLLALAASAVPPRGRGVVRGVLVLLCGLFLLRAGGSLHARFTPQREPYRLPAWAETLRPLAGQKGQLLVTRNSRFLAVNTDLNIIAPTRWVFTFLWDEIPAWDPRGEVFGEMLEEIRQHHCEFIADFAPVNPYRRSELQAAWDKFIESNYEQIDADAEHGMKLYRRRR